MKDKTRLEYLDAAKGLGLAVFVLFNLWEKGKIVEKIWLFLGKHSTNIWLTHMFFYLYIFIGAIQRLQYPVLMFGGMIAVCVAVSVVILKLHEIICDRKGKNSEPYFDEMAREIKGA